MKLSFSRFLALMLCVLLLALPLLATCEEASEETSSAGSSVSGTASGPAGVEGVDSIYLDEDGHYTLEKLERPEFNVEEKEFRVCVYNNVVQNTYFSEEIGYDMYETTDDAINEGVRTRNDLVEEQYGVKVVAYAVDDVASIIHQSITVGDDTFDAAMPFMNWCTGIAQEGSLWDLKKGICIWKPRGGIRMPTRCFPSPDGCISRPGTSPSCRRSCPARSRSIRSCMRSTARISTATCIRWSATESGRST